MVVVLLGPGWQVLSCYLRVGVRKRAGGLAPDLDLEHLVCQYDFVGSSLHCRMPVMVLSDVDTAPYCSAPAVPPLLSLDLDKGVR